MRNYNQHELESLFKGYNPSGVVIPNVESDDGRGGKKVKDIFSTLNDSRIVMCDGQIRDEMASVIAAQLLHLDAVDSSSPIYLYINSPGGSITAGMAIYDTMLNVKCDVITIGFGMCASMGSFLLSAGNITGGKKGAKILPNCEVMIHQPLGGCKGQATDMMIHVNRIIEMKKQLTGHYAYFASQNEDSIIAKLPTVEAKLERLAEDMERDNFLTAEQALEYGLVSEIIISDKSEKLLEMKKLGYI